MKFWICIEERTENKIYRGWAYLAEWPEKRILKTWYPTAHYPRGGNGIRTFAWFEEDQAYYALDRQIVWKLDKDLNVIERIMPYKYFMGHQIVKYKGQLVYDTTLYDGLYFDHQRIALKHRIDINSVSTDGEGLYLFSRSSGRFFQYKPEFKMIVDNIDLKGCHDVHYLDDDKEIVYANGQDCKVYLIRSNNWTDITTFTLPVKGESTPCTKIGINKGFIRLDKDRVLVGSSPAQIFQLNLKTGETEDEWFIAEEIRETVHGLYPERPI